TRQNTAVQTGAAQARSANGPRGGRSSGARRTSMKKSQRTPWANTEAFCRGEVERMLKESKTKVIMPVVLFGLLRAHADDKQRSFRDREIRRAYNSAISALKEFLGHDVHIGAKYYDAYGSRMSRYSVLKSTGHLRYRLLSPYADYAAALCDWIPARIK